MTSMSGFLSTTEAAAYLGWSRDSVLRAVRRGHLAAMQYGSIVRIHRDDLDAFVASHRTAPAGRRLRSTAAGAA